MGPSLTPLEATIFRSLFPSGRLRRHPERRHGRGRVMASAERKERISNLIDQSRAALLNAKREWHEEGESAALRAFVDTLGLVVATLTNVLEKVTPRLRRATMNEIEGTR